MKLKAEQEAAVREWVEEGADLGEIQTRLESEFEIRITYMETRFLIGDLNLSLIEEEEPEPEEETPEPPKSDEEIVEEAVAAPAQNQEAGAPEAEIGSTSDDAVSDAPDAAGGNVAVTIDKITIPGAAVSGSATFSDGKSAKWYLDQMGQLGFEPETPGYRPPDSDLEAFQTELSKALQGAGF